ncbi:hypothetical protein [Vibrio aestuarianus]|uniref:Uncharacterized protein n=1 Tax=Vibrio aestuarianus TaxID=28171 RepID=A0ABM9FL55_9VIBR|nr:hypothetical protein [Vibrio aestuarianus]MDE1227199.1 hypothetical protein [Vibrio aestuarianus]MDE1255301.1 hypothetical protein [Vibrio aestuarianus]MDE1270109.1 hypothetical protein [Vibrio aestuarianus]MDE1307742.1 hypothetical protein [Vibrio aestuarianus]MDH5890786.1 hypothetical protein [Vibrio aestuarianus]
MNKNEFKNSKIWINASDIEKAEIMEKMVDMLEEQNKALKIILAKKGMTKENILNEMNETIKILKEI